MSEHDIGLSNGMEDSESGGVEQSPSPNERIIMIEFLQILGLAEHYDKKLTLSTVLQIGKDSVTDEPAQSLSDLPKLFLKRLMMLKRTARGVKYTSSDGRDTEDSDWEDDEENNESDFCLLSVNPLDILTSLFLCSDSFLQQEMILKMSMCQFAVPLLLPNSNKNQITLMLWAMRNMVQQYRPHSLADQSGFVEKRIVLLEQPLVSFVRLGRCNISKSHILNKLLSNPQEYTETFVHSDMDCGNIPRKISNGLVEISWYLPCGKKNIDVFPEPVAIANLRGDLQDFETQYCFLCQTSTAMFVFLENKSFETKLILSSGQNSNLKLFLVSDSVNESIKNTAKKLNLKKSNFIIKANQNDAEFVQKIQTKLKGAVEKNCHKMSVVRLAEIARDIGISVDEDNDECQKAKARADEITLEITDIEQFKETNLPLQGDILKKLAKLEKEECRMKKVGEQKIEIYKNDLHREKMKLRDQQNRKDISDIMSCFISAISDPTLDRAYFLRWMKINLEDLSHKVLPSLRKEYKKKCEDGEEDIDKLDKISNSSLGIEHFIREMGQLYEAAVCLSENTESKKQLEHLPRLCAELLLDGFPLELVDGDASNLPVKWVTSVLSELNTLVQPKNKIVVVTVLGVQSSGKSTLLNTMFGVQFAVSSGRCTRGAFMLLIRVTDDFKEEVNNCDYILILDTEGLKSQQLAQLENSYEHDNELATLVVGLSDLTIVNMTMENSAEMKDILQIVVHAFLRMKEVGKTHKCLFVHQNVANVSAHDSNMLDRKFLLDQLDEMTRAAAKMENKLEYKKFTDVMEYDAKTGDHYIPGLWHGNPPMAQVSAGYSESVYDLKRNIMEIFKFLKLGSICDFLAWTTSLWDAVKFEKFIFNFRNSLVADAYIKLCTEYNKWDWELRKKMHTWALEAETKILNHGKFSEKISGQDTIKAVAYDLQKIAEKTLLNGENSIIDKITAYYDQGNSHVELVERYRQDFINSACSLRKELSNSIRNKLEAALSRRNDMINVEGIKKSYMDTMEVKVLNLLENCRKNKSDMSEPELNNAFENMWDETVKTCPVLQQEDIMDKVLQNLKKNLLSKGSSVAQSLDEVTSLENFGIGDFVVSKGNFFTKHVIHSDWIKKAQEMSDKLIKDCRKYVQEKLASKADYDDTYTREILNIIDDRITNQDDLRIKEDFELSLKLHICGFASREFQNIHNQFIQDNSPQRVLEKSKETFCSGFIDLFHERDQCQRKADEFINKCLTPIVEKYISEVLGTEMAAEMLIGENSLIFGTRTAFQYSVLKNLLDEFNFTEYVKCVESYEEYVKKFISDKVKKHFSAENRLFKLEERLLSEVTKEIMQAISDTEQEPEKDEIKEFIQSICKKLQHRLVFPEDSVDTISRLSNVNQKKFAESVKRSVEEMDQSLKTHYKDTDIQRTLEKLKMKPQDVLFKRVWGCGKQCPFCKAPCEAGGKAHTKHFVSMHRPEGLGGYKFKESKKLVTDICTSLVHSEMRFSCSDTNNKWHPHNKYYEIYPDWQIDPDSSIEASAYWKYVMAKFNEQFAEKYNVQPADIPEYWNKITKDEAEKSLK